MPDSPSRRSCEVQSELRILKKAPELRLLRGTRAGTSGPPIQWESSDRPGQVSGQVYCPITTVYFRLLPTPSRNRFAQPGGPQLGATDVVCTIS